MDRISTYRLDPRKGSSKKLFCVLIYIAKASHFTFWILELLEKGGLYVLLATRPSSKIFRVGYE